MMPSNIRHWMVMLSLAAAVSLCLPAAEQEKPPEFKPEVRKLGESLHEIRISGVTILALAGPEGTLLVDAGYEVMGDAIAKTLKNLDAFPPRFIVDTHWHFDHTGGNLVFGKEALVLAHRSVLEVLSKDTMLLGTLRKAYPEEARPDLVFEHPVELRLNGERIVITPIPGGHTAGDAVVLFEKANVLHAGDMVFADMFPFVDVDHGGSVVRLADNLQTLIDLAPEGVTILPGHGRPLTVEDVKVYRKMVLETTVLVKKEMAKGVALETLRKSDLLKDWEGWAKAFSSADWIEFTYKSLQRNEGVSPNI